MFSTQQTNDRVEKEEKDLTIEELVKVFLEEKLYTREELVYLGLIKEAPPLIISAFKASSNESKFKIQPFNEFQQWMDLHKLN